MVTIGLNDTAEMRERWEIGSPCVSDWSVPEQAPGHQAEWGMGELQA